MIHHCFFRSDFSDQSKPKGVRQHLLSFHFACWLGRRGCALIRNMGANRVEAGVAGDGILRINLAELAEAGIQGCDVVEGRIFHNGEPFVL